MGLKLSLLLGCWTRCPTESHRQNCTGLNCAPSNRTVRRENVEIIYQQVPLSCISDWWNGSAEKARFRLSCHIRMNNELIVTVKPIGAQKKEQCEKAQKTYKRSESLKCQNHESTRERGYQTKPRFSILGSDRFLFDFVSR